MSVFIAEEEASIARSLSDISLSPDVSVVVVENKELRCETRLLIENAKYFQALFAFQLGNQMHSNKSPSLLNPVTLMGGIDYESARVILTGLQTGTDVHGLVGCRAVPGYVLLRFDLRDKTVSLVKCPIFHLG